MGGKVFDSGPWCGCRCSIVDVVVEMDRLLRPGGAAVVRDSPKGIEKVARMARAVRWAVSVHGAEAESSSGERVLVATKELWKLPQGAASSR